MTHIEQRIDSAYTLAGVNPIPHKGEAVHEEDTGKWKLGDGVTAYNDLPYKGGVDMVAGKTGEVDLEVADVDGAAPLADPVFTGMPKAPTRATSDDSTNIATTEFVKNVAEAGLVSPAFTGNPTAPTPGPTDDDTSIATTEWVRDLMLAMHPVGDIKMSVVNVNPGTYLGGTWAPWGSGRVPVGVDVAQVEFDTVEEIGGAKTHTLTVAEMPSHDHAQKVDSSYNAQSGGTPTHYAQNSDNFAAATGGLTTGTRGSGQPHNNLQPYITCYMFKRTA